MTGQASTSRLLLTSLADFVREATKNYSFPSPDGSFMDCRVFLHGVAEEQEDRVYPFVVVRWLDGEIRSEADATTILRDTVALMLGVWSPRSQAEAGLLNAELLDCLRRALWKQRILGRRFELAEPLRASMTDYDRKTHRFHLATIETVWEYVWPPKALELAGVSQLKEKTDRVSAYPEKVWEKYAGVKPVL